MKVLFISNGYPPDRWAGTETYTAGIAKTLHERGHRVQVICAGKWRSGSSHWNGYSDEIYQGVPVRRINLNWKKAPDPCGYLYNNPVVADYLGTFLDQSQPDLVHVTSCETLSASVLRAVKDAQLPLVLSLTDFWFLCPRINLLHADGTNCDGRTTAWECLRCKLLNQKVYRWPRRVLPRQTVSRLLTRVSKYPILTRRRGLRGMVGDMAHRKAFLRRAINWPDYRITASPFVRDVHVANGVVAPISVQPYGHDLSWLDSYTGKTRSELIRIGFIGQIIESKGVHLLLQAAAMLNDSNRDKYELLVYGNLEKTPDYGTQLRALADGLDNVRFCGTYSHDESADVFANIDVLVVPSLWYDFPLIIDEAFATGTPVIATDLGGMAEAVSHEVSGLLFERDDVDDLARQLGRILEDPGLLARLRAGVPPVKAIDEEVSELEAIYTDLIRQQSYQPIVFGH
jgi:glycosyltransferase involved in cell wall biosynthesis